MLAATTAATPATADLPICTWTKIDSYWYVQFPFGTTPKTGFVIVRKASGETQEIYATVVKATVRGVEKLVGLKVDNIKRCPHCGGKAVYDKRSAAYKPYFTCTTCHRSIG